MNEARELASVVQNYFRIIKAPHDEATRAFLNDCQSFTVRSGNTDYQYYRRGSGPTVVLVHGLHSNLGSMAPLATDLVANGYEVVLFDAPAHGEARGMSTTPVQVRQFIWDLNQQLGELQAVICHSLGGVWALSAWNDAFHAKTLITISSPATHRFLVTKFAALNQLRDELVEKLVMQLERRFGDGLWDDFSPAEIVRSITVPGLIIHGQADEFVPPDHAPQIKANWPAATLEMIEGAGHFEIGALPRVRQLVSEHLSRLA
ncbi:MAG: hypothetical protein Tsb002_29460 [Wenzhouxiangellaceae bacterium]